MFRSTLYHQWFMCMWTGRRRKKLERQAFVASSEIEGERLRGIYTADDLITRAGVVGGMPTLREDGVAVYLGGVAPQAILASDGTAYAKGGDPAPGGVQFEDQQAAFNYPSANDVGEVAFSASLAPRQEGVFTANRRIAVTDEEAPDGGVFYALEGSPDIDDGGRVVYAGKTSEGLWAIFDSDGGIIARANELAFPGALLVGLADPVLTGGGQVVFWARLRDDAGESREGLLITRREE